ncbi:hypothetical protein QE152_g38241 [Popillia japonica]|uniref:Uncharacterized protein n=1 Tax=Popillia japonica TaxID=7064 RepID=A0AAW1I822_POPJA
MEFKPPRKLDLEGDIRGRTGKLDLEGDIRGNWNKFKQAYEIFITATNRKNSEKEIKAAIFLNLIGEEAVDLFNTFNLTADEKKDIDKIINAFENYIQPRNQTENKTFDVFLKDIKRLADMCEFGTEKENMIRDRVVIGIKNREEQERLLRMPNLNLAEAVDVCRAAEISKLQARTLNNESATDSIVYCYKTQQIYKQIQIW